MIIGMLHRTLSFRNVSKSTLRIAPPNCYFVCYTCSGQQFVFVFSILLQPIGKRQRCGCHSFWLEFYKCFNLVLLLAVPTVVNIKLIESIIRITRCGLGRHSPECSLSVEDWSSCSQHATRTRILWRIRVRVRAWRACLRVLGNRLIQFSCLFIFTGKKTKKTEERFAAALKPPALTEKPLWTEGCIGSAVRRVQPLIRHTRTARR